MQNRNISLMPEKSTNQLKLIPSSKRYDTVLETARELFWKYGYKRVSIEEIAEKAGVSKMTFYRFFPNKLELAKAVLQKVIDKGLVAFRDILFSDEHAPDQKVRMLLLLKMEGSHEISKEFLMDFYDNPELGLRDYIENLTREAWKGVVKDFKKAQKEGIFRKDFKPELFFSMSENIMHLMSNKALVDSYDSPQKLIMEIADLMIYGIVPRK